MQTNPSEVEVHMDGVTLLFWMDSSGLNWRRTDPRAGKRFTDQPGHVSFQDIVASAAGQRELNLF